MENQAQIQNTDLQNELDELDNELDGSAGYFVRTDLRAGGCPETRVGMPPSCMGYCSTVNTQ